MASSACPTMSLLHRRLRCEARLLDEHHVRCRALHPHPTVDTGGRVPRVAVVGAHCALALELPMRQRQGAL
eukprot:7119460-Pyramimonas_sp.AAC.1